MSLVIYTQPPGSPGKGFRFLRASENIEDHQPGVQFFNTARRWVKSKVIKGQINGGSEKRYRVKL